MQKVPVRMNALCEGEDMAPTTSGMVFDIQRFSIHDGPGIRTTVFLKGCPLHCPWCHNPESQLRGAEIFYNSSKCIACAACEVVCVQGCHAVGPTMHIFDRADCMRCGECVAHCPSGALEQAGHMRTVEDVLAAVMRDAHYYESSGGGITISGGEPMAQFRFTQALLRAAKSAGLHACLDTCGVAPWHNYQLVAADVDLFLWDYKESDPARHRELTGGDLEGIINNLRLLDAAGARSILRCPGIPGINDRHEHFQAIGKLADSLHHLVEVQIEPYHRMGIGKYERLGKSYALCDVMPPDKAQAVVWMNVVAEHCHKEVRIG